MTFVKNRHVSTHGDHRWMRQPKKDAGANGPKKIRRLGYLGPKGMMDDMMLCCTPLFDRLEMKVFFPSFVFKRRNSPFFGHK